MTTPSELIAYPSWNVNAVMRDIYDLGERMLLFPMLLGTVARQIHDEQDFLFDLKVYEGETIEWAIFKKNETPEIISLFKTWNFKPNDKGWEYSFEHIPVQIRVLKRNYEFFKRPDTKFYKVDEFHLPNPFENYWKARNIIQ